MSENTTLSFSLLSNFSEDFDCQESKFGCCPYICCSEIDDEQSYEEYKMIMDEIEAEDNFFNSNERKF
tara:strand:+ start:322 stop:525 length:204 start_codon:yes stop_codon:yes gene_type:complete